MENQRTSGSSDGNDAREFISRHSPASNIGSTKFSYEAGSEGEHESSSFASVSPKKKLRVSLEFNSPGLSTLQTRPTLVPKAHTEALDPTSISAIANKEVLSPLSPIKGVLYSCFKDVHLGVVLYSIRAVSVAKLIAGCSAEDFLEIYSWSGDGACDDMACINLGAKVYFVGGGFPNGFDTCPCHSYLPHFSPNLFLVDLSQVAPPSFVSAAASSDSAFPKPSPLKPLLCPKASPVVVELNGIFYVLGLDMYVCPLSEECCDYTFEAYHPSSDEWFPLEDPPFFIYDSKYYDTCIWSYVVIEGKICASTTRASFTYDPQTGRWEPCQLFADLSPYEYMPKWPELRNVQDQTPCGPPFPFVDKAVIFEGDTMICFVPGIRSVVAYQIESGKAVRKQVLDNLGIFDEGFFNDLLDLGRGYFCLLFQWHTGLEYAYVTFRISKVSEVTSDVFLECVALKMFSQEKIVKGEGCHPTFSFAL